MSVMTVFHQGLGVWMNRGSHWELMFPVAEHAKTPEGRWIAPHDPSLYIDGAYTEDGKPVYWDLRNWSLDLRKATHAQPKSTVAQSFLIGLRPEAGSPVTRKAPFVECPEAVNGVVQFTPGMLSPGAYPLVGPACCGTEMDMLLTYREAWSAPLVSDTVSISRTLRDGSEQESITLRGDATRNGAITLVIQVLSLADRMGQKPTESRSDDDFAANYLLTHRPDSPAPTPVPQFMPRTVAPHQITLGEVHTLGYSEDSLCAGAFVDGDI